MQGYCENCKKFIVDTTRVCSVDGFIVCHGCYDILEGNKVISYGTWTKMTRKERKASRKKMRAYVKFHEANKDKECELCGCGLGEVALFEVHKIMDSKYVFDGETIVLCHNCMTGVDFIEFFNAVRR